MGIIKSYFRISKEQFEQLKSAKDGNIINEILRSSIENLDIDKAWQLLHYIITGEEDFCNHPFSKFIYPSSFTIEISDEEEIIIEEYYENGMQNQTEEILGIEVKLELGQGFVNPNEIKEIISLIDRDQIIEKIEKVDFSTFNEIGIYPEIWTNTAEHKDYAKDHFHHLYSFLQRAVEENDFVIVI